jgi:hypothetical protein
MKEFNVTFRRPTPRDFVPEKVVTYTIPAEDLQAAEAWARKVSCKDESITVTEVGVLPDGDWRGS